jgi:imidazolonepropionase-like amidohydrolase
MTEMLITAGRVITGPDGEFVADGAVLVRDGGIVAAGPREHVEPLAPEGTSTHSFPDGTVLPGLIDSHAHLAFDASPDPVAALRERTDEELLAGMADRARQLLRTGVTTVRDLGDRNGLAIRLREAIAAGELPGPGIVSAATPLTQPGGHCWFLGGEVEGEAAIREMVRRNAEAGADVIKVMASGGGLTKGGPAVWQPQFTAAELRMVVEEAQRFGLPVAVHAHGTESIAAAVAAGVRTIEHCTWMSEGGKFDMRQELVEQINSRGIYVCTATSPNWRALAQRVGQERAEQMFTSMRWMAEQGVRFIAGTDAGIPRATFDSFVNTLEFLEYLGLSAAQIIDSATTNAAQALGIATTTGRLREGLRADLLAVQGNPLENLAALRDIRLVVSAGQRVELD